MSEWHPLHEDMTLEDGEMIEVSVDGVHMLIARVDSQFYASQALCPHLRGRLARGTLDGHTVICPEHGSRFDVRDGRNLDWIPGLPSLARRVAQAVSRPTDLQVYPTRTEDGQLWVQTQ